MKFITLLAALLCLTGLADAQIQGNKLCLHSGGEYYVNGPFNWSPNIGAGRYFPSFTHWSSTSINNTGKHFPWKLSGFSWAGMQGYQGGNLWTWECCLQTSADNPWSDQMSFDYPVLFQSGAVSPKGYPDPIFWGKIPSVVPAVGKNNWLFPSSKGGFNAYLNILAAASGVWNVPSTVPFYSWLFSYNWGCAPSGALSVPSATSFWQNVWTNKGPNLLYCTLDGDSFACDGSGGNKGRNYSLISDPAMGTFWCWMNSTGSGTNSEWAMCLFVCDVVTIPVNYPGSTRSTNPFLAYGFDTGPATITPFASSLKMNIGFMTEDWANTSAGMPRIILGGLAASGKASAPYGAFNYRVPFAWDFLTSLLATNGLSLLIHTPTANYPACMWGPTIGAHTISIPQTNTNLVGLEIRWASFPANPLAPMSASFKATYF